MTSIVAWAGVDQRAPASIYIASDSRISWGYTHRWDQGRKTFACKLTPHIFGYWGDVLFPSMVLPTIVEQLEARTIGRSRTPFGDIGSSIRKLWQNYPEPEHRDFGIIMGSRTGAGMVATFNLAVMTFSAAKRDWHLREYPMPEKSAQLCVSGSGANDVRHAQQLWDTSAHAGTSRSVYSAFCEALSDHKDSQTGGGPQLVGLHRLGNGQTFGTIFNGRRHVSGAVLNKTAASQSQLAWFNDLFERVDGARMRRLTKAQRHAER